MKIIVVSAVNIVEAGPLTILRDCLSFLSEMATEGEYKVIAIVHKKELAYHSNLEYIETQWPKKRWVNRLWYEYVGMKKLSREIGPVHLWFSLHDTSPSVFAEHRAVYCHNSFSFYKWRLHDLIFAPKIALFALFTKYIYRTNILKNDYLVVQQKWFRKKMASMFNFEFRNIIVAPPKREKILHKKVISPEFLTSFIFPSSPNSHKNFEVICQAVEILQKQFNLSNFKVFITVKGTENRYAKWLFKKWGTLDALEFIGFVSKPILIDYYAKCSCLIFSSKIESWGLPISEFSSYRKPMLLADLPYARETAEGSNKVAFFDPDRPAQLARQMKKIIEGDTSFLSRVPEINASAPVASNWRGIFNILLQISDY